MKSRTFTTEDQLAFAKLSGDYNPLHIDAVAARRLIFGSPVVHGIHTLLWGLDCLLENREDHLGLRSIKAAFPKPITVGEEVSFSLIHKEDGCFSIELLSNETIVTRITVELDESAQRSFDYLETSFPKKLEPRALLDNQIETDTGTLGLYLNIESAAKMFPHLIKCFSPVQLAAILSTTRLIGVKCPGLHSIYSEIVLSATPPNGERQLNYEVKNLDKRVGLVRINITVPDMTGTIKAFRRPAPLEQQNYLSLKDKVEKNEFSNQRALIIGGSRGLGEVAAKLLSGGGANVKITYHQGKEDADAIVEDIISNGGIADSFCFDVLNPKIDTANISASGWTPTHLYYFATPFVFSGVKGKFSAALFNKFCNYYIVGFINTVNLLSNFGIKQVFCPSTVAVDELPTNMIEYTVAKSASEILCRIIEKNNPEIIIYKPRFPRMATDQTASIMPVLNHDPAPTMLKQLRSFRDDALISK